MPVPHHQPSPPRPRGLIISHHHSDSADSEREPFGIAGDGVYVESRSEHTVWRHLDALFIYDHSEPGGVADDGDLAVAASSKYGHSQKSEPTQWAAPWQSATTTATATTATVVIVQHSVISSAGDHSAIGMGPRESGQWRQCGQWTASDPDPAGHQLHAAPAVSACTVSGCIVMRVNGEVVWEWTL